MINFSQFLDIVNEKYNGNEFELRYGQTIMNVLNYVWPDKYKEITNTSYDCFYNDGIVDKTLTKLHKEWI